MIKCNTFVHKVYEDNAHGWQQLLLETDIFTNNMGSNYILSPRNASINCICVVACTHMSDYKRNIGNGS